jgi:hypothetical protein
MNPGQIEPAQIDLGDKWQAVAAGNYHAAALKADGTLWSWGDNGYGQLGDGTAWRETPTKVGGPVVTVPPSDRSGETGTTVTFSVIASGSQPLSYQWRKDGSNLTNGGKLSGVTTPNLSVANVQPGDAGAYTVVVTNPYDSVTSELAVLVLTSPGQTQITRVGPGSIRVFFNGVLQHSADLATWTNYTPQPSSPLTLPTDSTARFFRARAGSLSVEP